MRERRVAFKSSSVTFSDILYQTTSNASGANATTGTGGVNAKQIGLGTTAAATKVSITSAVLQLCRAAEAWDSSEEHLCCKPLSFSFSKGHKQRPCSEKKKIKKKLMSLLLESERCCQYDTSKHKIDGLINRHQEWS